MCSTLGIDTEYGDIQGGVLIHDLHRHIHRAELISRADSRNHSKSVDLTSELQCRAVSTGPPAMTKAVRRPARASTEPPRILPAGFHFHDLRHTGNQLAANSGATTRELMHRMGHGSMRAALVYQHATTERDRSIVDALSELVDLDRTDGKATEDEEEDGGDGSAGALGPVA